MVHCILHTAYCTLHTAHCILHTSYCTLHTALFILHTAYCTLLTAYTQVVETYRIVFRKPAPIPDIERLHPAELVGTFSRYK